MQSSQVLYYSLVRDAPCTAGLDDYLKIFHTRLQARTPNHTHSGYDLCT